MIIVTLDLCGLDLRLADEIAAEIERHTGISREGIMLNCSHTHNAPFTIPWYITGWRLFEKGMKPWRAELVKKIVNTALLAKLKLHEAKLFYGRAPVRIGFNRRLPTKDGVVMKPNLKGAIVPWVDVLWADGLDGRSIVVLFSHAAHPVIVHGASAMISADYPGFAVKTVRRKLGRKTIVMFAQGCGANINGEPLRGGFAAAEKAGKILGAAVLKAMRKTRPLAGTDLRFCTFELHLPFRKPPRPEVCAGELKKWQEKYDAQKEKNWYTHNMVLVLKELLKLSRKREKRYLKFAIHAFAVGKELCITGLTHEMFAEYQLWIDKISPFRHNMVFGYTNGCESYIPCAGDFVLGGYEAASFPTPCSALAYRNRLTLAPGIEKQINAGLKKTFQSFLSRC